LSGRAKPTRPSRRVDPVCLTCPANPTQSSHRTGPNRHGWVVEPAWPVRVPKPAQPVQVVRSTQPIWVVGPTQPIWVIGPTQPVRVTKPT